MSQGHHSSKGDSTEVCLDADAKATRLYERSFDQHLKWIHSNRIPHRRTHIRRPAIHRNSHMSSKGSRGCPKQQGSYYPEGPGTSLCLLGSQIPLVFRGAGGGGVGAGDTGALIYGKLQRDFCVQSLNMVVKKVSGCVVDSLPSVDLLTTETMMV